MANHPLFTRPTSAKSAQSAAGKALTGRACTPSARHGPVQGANALLLVPYPQLDSGQILRGHRSHTGHNVSGPQDDHLGRWG